MQIIYTTTGNVNTPLVSGSATALAANTSRIGWRLQNLGTNVLFVRLGASAGTTIYHVALKACTANDDGLGDSFSQMQGVIYTGIVTTAGTSPRYVALEIAP